MSKTITLICPQFIKKCWVGDLTWQSDHLIDPSGAETRIFQENYDITMAADALAPCVARTSAAMLLTIWYKQVCVSHAEIFEWSLLKLMLEYLIRVGSAVKHGLTFASSPVMEWNNQCFCSQQIFWLITKTLVFIWYSVHLRFGFRKASRHCVYIVCIWD